MQKPIIGGIRTETKATMEVRSPFSGAVVDVVGSVGPEEVESALKSAVVGAETMRKTTAFERGQWLRRAAQILAAHVEEFATTLSREEGKTLAESRFEVGRTVQTLELSAEAARSMTGEGIPLDAAPGGSGRLGFTLRVPCGVVVAISPFNFPLNLVSHKIGPAIAGGNAFILKPASQTPLSALKLCDVLLEAGVPAAAVSCLTGPGGELGRILCSDPRVRKISFTGSQAVGETICKMAGVKRVTMELGSNSPLIVMDDADIDAVVAATVATGYGNAGQVCISTQRVLVDSKCYGDYLDALKPKVEAIATGDPLHAETKMGPLVQLKEAERVGNWIDEAVSQGAKLVAGGERSGTMMQPTILADVRPEMKVVREELFGPAVAVASFDDIDQAIAMANDTRYGLAAAIFTQNISRALRFIREVHSGNLHVNWGPGWRADLMPYGGLKDSGIGKEGPLYAIREMTEEKMVVIHG